MQASPDYPARLQDIAKRLRQARAQPPAGMPTEIFVLYREMMRASFAASLEDAFPQSKAQIRLQDWEALVDDFLARGSCPSPSFHQVPDAFLAFVLEQLDKHAELPEYLPASLHWEWLTLTLAISTAPLAEAPEEVLPDACLQLAAAARLQHYPYAVHLGTAPPAPRDCYLLIFRDRSGAVCTRELGIPEARLAAALAAAPLVAAQAHAAAFPHDEYAPAWTQACLADWWREGILASGT